MRLPPLLALLRDDHELMHKMVARGWWEDCRRIGGRVDRRIADAMSLGYPLEGLVRWLEHREAPPSAR
jgi:hypothetical protein